MSEEEDSVVSRRQFFRGVTGDILRAVGELSGLDRLEEHLREPLVLTELDQMVSPERQATAMSEIFGFLEHLDTSPDPQAEHDASAEHEALVDHQPPVEPEVPAEHHRAATEHDAPA